MCIFDLLFIFLFHLSLEVGIVDFLSLPQNKFIEIIRFRPSFIFLLTERMMLWGIDMSSPLDLTEVYFSLLIAGMVKELAGFSVIYGRITLTPSQRRQIKL